MLVPRRIESYVAPKAFNDLGNGNWYYNYDIQSREVTVPSRTEDGKDTQETIYSYIQVKMAGKPTYKRCVELIIGKFITQSQEFDLINTYNRATLNLLSEDDNADEEVRKYKEYLDKVKEIKKNIKKDFK